MFKPVGLYYGFGVQKTAFKIEKLMEEKIKWIRYPIAEIRKGGCNKWIRYCLNQWARIWLRGTENTIKFACP